MLARARLKLKNTESSIAFIQEQHTRTLEGLHQEIQQLQQKNARLTFELAVQGTSAPKQETCKHADEIQAYKSEVHSLQTALTTCKEEIKFLKHKLMSVESNLSEEVAERDAQIGHLSAEVERRARIIAHLTKQLHQMRMEFTRFLEDASRMQSVTVAPGPDHSGSQRTATVEPPATAVGQIRRRTRRATSSAIPHNHPLSYSPFSVCLPEASFHLSTAKIKTEVWQSAPQTFPNCHYHP
ncbi:Coiled-coil domain-containing protein 92 [Geodia barretti]|uniref:Coiled-coil domain-containing protein 92 n=1 Tax=Geodia barretti TaxID=519541 RepID=A0AA35W6L2_GEOBA|nr:Coiled-coil domain-containing protein 92 [Geodia barretti]